MWATYSIRGLNPNQSSKCHKLDFCSIRTLETIGQRIKSVSLKVWVICLRHFFAINSQTTTLRSLSCLNFPMQFATLAYSPNSSHLFLHEKLYWSIATSLICVLYDCLSSNDRVELLQQRTYDLQNLKYSLTGTLQKKLAELCPTSLQKY